MKKTPRFSLKDAVILGSFLLVIPALPVIPYSYAAETMTRERLTQSEFELKSELERHFREKVRTALPNIRFSLEVEFIPYAKIDLSIIGYQVGVREHDEATLNRVRKIKFNSDRVLPPETLALILGVPRGKIQFRTTPFAKIEAEPTAVTASQSEPDDGKTISSPLSDTPPSATSTISESSTPGFFQKNFQVALVFIFSTLTLIGLLLVRVVGRIRHSISGLGKTLTETGIKSLNSSTDAGDFSAEMQKLKPAPLSLAPSGRGSPRENEPNPNQIVAFFSECYWTAEDEAAAALVRRYPSPEFYAKLSYGTEYLDYLRSVDAGDLSLMEDSYFISPRSEFFEIAVKDTPKGALRIASEMRVRASGITNIELLQLQDMRLPFSFTTLVSAKRNLPVVYRVHLKDIAEEAFLLANKELSEGIKQRLPSLYRLASLPREQQVTIFSDLSAVEIAQAWIGPKEILAQLLPQVPERKRLLLADLKLKVTPSRESPSFRRILKRADFLRSETPSIPEKKAA